MKGLRLLAKSLAFGVLISSCWIYLHGVSLVTHQREVKGHHHDHDHVNHTDLPEKPRVCTHQQRVKGVELACERKGGIQWNNSSSIPIASFPNFLVDDKHQLMYCGFAKAASTSWLTHFVKASGKWNKGKKIAIRGKAIERYGFKHLHSLPEKAARDRLKNYKKMVVVRHPLDRLVSAWRDKFVMKDSPYRKKIGKQIIKKFRGKYHEGDTTTFDEFAHFVALGSMDPHWGTYRSCKPCLVRYDYISRTETVVQDSGDIMTALGLGNQLPVVHAHRSAGLQATEIHLWQFENVSRAIYEKLLDVYQSDMNTFGYGFNFDNRTAYCSMQKLTEENCC